MEEQVITMPVVALRGLTILPGMVQHFDVSRPRSVAAVEKAMMGDQKLFLVSQRHPELQDPELKDLYQVGTVAVVKQLVKLPGKMVRVLTEGLERGELLGFDSEDPFFMGEISPMAPEQEDVEPMAKEAMVRILRDKLEEYGKVNSAVPSADRRSCRTFGSDRHPAALGLYHAPDGIGVYGAVCAV